MPSVLIVDDEQGIRATLSEFLRDENFEVETAADVEEAQKLLGRRRFDVVVTDIIMPRLSGVDLLKSIHDQQPLAQVILITGEPLLDTATQALRAGAYDYLQKPVTRQKILGVVTSAAKVKILLDEKDRLEQENRRYRKELEVLLDERTRALLESEELHQSLIQHMPVGFAHLEYRLATAAFPADLILLEMNDVFARLTRLARHDVVGQSVRATFPAAQPFTELIDRLLGLAAAGASARFTFASGTAGRAYDLIVYPPRTGFLVVLVKE